jgi:hypothetical protein
MNDYRTMLAITLESAALGALAVLRSGPEHGLGRLVFFAVSPVEARG